jgi:uncharacterized protein YjbJ (UPF0337 family)
MGMNAEHPGGRETPRETPASTRASDPVREHWDELRAKLHAQWGRITDDDLGRIDGDRERLVQTLRERYALTEDEARRQVEAVTRGWHSGGDAR